MSEFERALLSSCKNEMIPAEDDWYAPLLGDWKFEYYEPDGRHLKGEWFSAGYWKVLPLKIFSSARPGRQRKPIRSRTGSMGLQSGCITKRNAVMT